MSYCAITTTAGSKSEADKIAALLLEHRTAACVQQMPVSSQYWWNGKIEKEDEILLLIKTRDELYPRVQEIIKSVHSYEVPEILKLPIQDGLTSYIDWIAKETKESA